MEKLSIACFWLALSATSLAVLLYWGYALGVRVALRRLATSPGSSMTVATLEKLPESIGRAASLSSWTAAFFLGVSMFARWRDTGHAPYSNMWEFTVAFAAGVIAFNIIFERWYSQRTLGAFLQPLALAMLAMAAAFFPSDPKPLVPALQSNGILAIHVGMMIVAYAALSVSFGAALMYLAQGGSRNRFPRLPRASLLDEIAYKSVILGFPILAIGIALGAYWGNSAWGRYWGWDPKETAALVTWLIYGVYLHMRAMRSWSGTRSAVMLVGAYGAVLFTYFAVNLWVSGLHSYAGV